MLINNFKTHSITSQGTEENIPTEKWWGDRELEKTTYEELHNLYSSPSITYNDQVKEIGRASSSNGGEEECIKDISGRVRRKDTTRKI
jgi:hypothetical protein